MVGLPPLIVLDIAWFWAKITFGASFFILKVSIFAFYKIHICL